jgi:hypothetical protein
MLSILPLPSGPPFSIPTNATYSGGVVPDEDKDLFSQLGAAQALVARYTLAAKRAGLMIVVPFAVTDGIYGPEGSYGQFMVMPLPSGQLTDTSIWLITGTVANSKGTQMIVVDVAGNLLSRYYTADMAQNDKNYVEEGTGATEQNQTVPGKICLQLLPSEGLAQGRYMPAS